jgi:hypothetical protein
VNNKKTTSEHEHLQILPGSLTIPRHLSVFIRGFKF